MHRRLPFAPATHGVPHQQIPSPLLRSSAAIPFLTRTPEASRNLAGGRPTAGLQIEVRSTPAGSRWPPRPAGPITDSAEMAAAPQTRFSRRDAEALRRHATPRTTRSVRCRFGRETSVHRRRPFAPAAHGVPRQQIPSPLLRFSAAIPSPAVHRHPRSKDCLRGWRTPDRRGSVPRCLRCWPPANRVGSA